MPDAWGELRRVGGVTEHHWWGWCDGRGTTSGPRPVDGDPTSGDEGHPPPRRNIGAPGVALSRLRAAVPEAQHAVPSAPRRTAGLQPAQKAVQPSEIPAPTGANDSEGEGAHAAGLESPHAAVHEALSVLRDSAIQVAGRQSTAPLTPQSRLTCSGGRSPGGSTSPTVTGADQRVHRGSLPRARSLVDKSGGDHPVPVGRGRPAAGACAARALPVPATEAVARDGRVVAAAGGPPAGHGSHTSEEGRVGRLIRRSRGESG